MATVEAPDAGALAGAATVESRSSTFARMARNVMALGASQAITMVASATLALILPRYLGDVNLGKLAFATAYTNIFAVATSLGAGLYVTKAVARNPSRALSYAANAIAMRVPAVIIAATVAVIIVNVTGYDPLTKEVTYILLVGMAIVAVYDILASALQGLQEMRLVARAQVAGVLLTAAAVTALLLSGYGVVAVALAYLAGMLIGLVVAAVALLWRTELHTKAKRGMLDATRRMSTNFGLWRTIFVGGLPFFVWQISLLIYGEVDRVMLSAMTHDAVVGWYAAAYRIVSFPTFIPVIAMTVAFPALASSSKDDRGTYNSITRRATQAVLVATIPFSTGLMLLAYRVPGVLGYPSEFDHSVVLMVILSIHIPVMAADMILGTALNAADKQKQWAIAGVAAACLNPALNFILIPITHSEYGNGAIGAASATVVTEVFMMFLALWLLPRGTLNLATGSVVIRALLAALAMAGAVWLLRDEFIAVPVLAGALVYVGLCAALRVVRPSDLRQLRQYVIERQRRAAAEG
jgi:O-antigen/teichoic acid export membrane protein